ncbi:MAG: hypothetical protein K0M40_16800 [Prolixibacteraceae bacterium]|nr:hypothetical protein [Prolixibacteraceae bacterium]
MSIRIYSYKDVVMLMAAKSILQSMQANLGELSMVRSNWTEAYVMDLITRIENAIENFLGLDKKQPLREATDLLKKIVAPALRDLSFIKTQVEVDFAENAAEILKTLGINKNLRNIDQEELIEVLYSFKKGIAPTLQNEITQKGTNPALIENIIGYATQLEQANLSQEGMKTATQNVSQEAVDAFNEIYTEVIGISKIASKFYQDDKLKKEQFTFTKVVKKMGSANKKDDDPQVD